MKIRGFPSVLAALTVGALTVTGTATFASTVTATGQFLAGNGSETAPSYSFTDSPGTGLFRPVANAFGIAVGGTEGFRFTQAGMTVYSSLPVSWGNAGMVGTNVSLYGDAPGVLSQRNGTAAQEFRVYGTTTGGRYVTVSHNGTYGVVGTSYGPLILGAGTGTYWLIDPATANFRPQVDGVYPIGAVGARVSSILLGGNTPAASAPMIDCAQTWNDAGVNFIGVDVQVVNTASGASSYPLRIRSGALGTSVVFKIDTVGSVTTGGQIEAYSYYSSTAAGYYFGSYGGLVSGGADGVHVLNNGAGTSFGRLCFGGTTSSFPAIARSASDLSVVLADGSAPASINVLNVVASNGCYTKNGTTYAGFACGGEGIGVLVNTAGNDFARLCWGGTTSAFPAIKRNGAKCQFRLADDSDYGDFEGRAFDSWSAGAIVRIGGVQVIGQQGAAVADATGAGDVVAQLNTLLARLRTHGLIAT